MCVCVYRVCDTGGGRLRGSGGRFPDLIYSTRDRVWDPCSVIPPCCCCPYRERRYCYALTRFQSYLPPPSAVTPTPAARHAGARAAEPRGGPRGRAAAPAAAAGQPGAAGGRGAGCVAGGQGARGGGGGQPPGQWSAWWVDARHMLGKVAKNTKGGNACTQTCPPHLAKTPDAIFIGLRLPPPPHLPQTRFRRLPSRVAPTSPPRPVWRPPPASPPAAASRPHPAPPPAHWREAAAAAAARLAARARGPWTSRCAPAPAASAGWWVAVWCGGRLGGFWVAGRGRGGWALGWVGSRPAVCRARASGLPSGGSLAASAASSALRHSSALSAHAHAPTRLQCTRSVPAVRWSRAFRGLCAVTLASLSAPA